MSYYLDNLEKLKDCSFESEIRYQNIESIGVDGAVCEKDGILYYQTEKGWTQLESRNAEEEIKLYTEHIDWKKENLFLVLGMGNRRLIKKLTEKTLGNSKVVIYEPNKKILKYMLENEELADILVKKNVLVWWKDGSEADNNKDYGYDIVVMNWANLAYNIEVITCPGYSQYLHEFKNVFDSVKKKVFQYFMSFGNALDDVLQGFQQNAKNFVSCMQTSDISNLKDKYVGMPAIIVSAGPSLEKNIDELKRAQGKAVILSCDASWTACKQHGVTPDAIVTLERGVETYQYYFEDKEFDKDLVLIGPSLIWDETLKSYKGKKVLVSKNDEGVDGWWSNQFEDLRYISTGASCATLAYTVAEILGCNPIVLIGQDLAFTGNKKHSKFTHTEFEGENNAEESDGLMVEDIYGEMIPTDKYYNLFRFWFEDRIQNNLDIQSIDATEGGAKIKGSVIMTLHDVIEQYCTKEKKNMLYEFVEEKQITPKQVQEKKEEIIREANKLIRKLYKTKKKTEEHYATLEKMYDRINDDMTKNQLVNVVKKMQKGDQIIKYMVAQSDTITFFRQYIAQTIAYVKALGNDLTPVNVLKNLYAQGNLMGAVKRACVMLVEEVEKLKETVEEECEIYCREMENENGTAN